MPSGYGVIITPPRQELYAAAFRSVHANRGTAYSCSETDIDRATHFRGRHSGQYIGRNRADREIVDQNSLRRVPGRSEAAAITRLKDAIRGCERHRWYPDLVVKAFLDLDKIFFCGRLRDIVKVAWKRNLNRPAVAGLCPPDRGNPNSGRCEIWLNADVILLSPHRSPFREVFATILHEMW